MGHAQMSMKQWSAANEDKERKIWRKKLMEKPYHPNNMVYVYCDIINFSIEMTQFNVTDILR